MPVNPITTPLPADLPENWVNTQTIAAEGTDVGLSEQHGYNYLMEQVNAAQQGVNALGGAFEELTPDELGITAKKTYTCVIGTTQNGWTAADCDYLCDGVDDQVEINAAIQSVPTGRAAVIKILPGAYRLTNIINSLKNNMCLVGTENATVIFNWNWNQWKGNTSNINLVSLGLNGAIYGISFSVLSVYGSYRPTILYYSAVNEPAIVKNCKFNARSSPKRLITGAFSAWINFENCTFRGCYDQVIQCYYSPNYTRSKIQNCTFELDTDDSRSSNSFINGFQTGTIEGCYFSGKAGSAVIESTSTTKNVLLLGNTFECDVPVTVGFSTSNMGGYDIRVIGNLFGESNTTFINFMSTALNLSNIVFSDNVVRSKADSEDLSQALQLSSVDSVVVSNNIIQRADTGQTGLTMNLQTVQRCVITNNIMDIPPVQVNVTNTLVENNLILNPEATS